MAPVCPGTISFPAVEGQLPPRLEETDRNCIGEVQTPRALLHWDANGAASKALDDCVGKASGFRSEQQTVPFSIAYLVIQAATTRGKSEQTCFISCIKKFVEILAEPHLSPLMVVKAGTF